MKFTPTVLLATIAFTAITTSTEAFAPSSSSSSSSSSSHAFLTHSTSRPRPSSRSSPTELNLFGLFKGAGSTKVKSTEAATTTSTSTSTPLILADLPGPSDVSKDQIRALFSLWNDALATGESQLVAKRYSTEAILLPTVSDVPRTDHDSIKDYFDTFLLQKPQGEILEGHITVGYGWAKDAGLYEFTMNKETAVKVKVKARYSFVYVWEGDQWKILHHHSSRMPEEVTPNDSPKLTSKDQVKNLFHLWNDALDTLDPEAVASRYSKNAVLLPTVSDTPRTDQASIQSYFVDFLAKQPQGTILESHVEMGPNWCKDVGIYEFTMGVDGSKVKARYSFVYTYEEGQWKISHHHSSAMPEGLMRDAAKANAGKADPLTDSEVKALFDKWNRALRTLDSDAVAKCYAINDGAVLLPTVSDVPRTDYDSIKDYFDVFLKQEPQGTIIESYVSAGEHWAKDVGIYEFTMGAAADDGGSATTTTKKVKARYSFFYVQDETDGEWKIAHHHSSVMPEGLMAAAAACDDKQMAKKKKKKKGTDNKGKDSVLLGMVKKGLKSL